MESPIELVVELIRNQVSALILERDIDVYELEKRGCNSKEVADKYNFAIEQLLKLNNIIE